MKTKRIQTFLILIVGLALFSCEDDLLSIELNTDQVTEPTLSDAHAPQDENSPLSSASGGALDNAGGLDGDSSTFY